MKFAIQSRRDAQSNELMELAKTYLQDFGLTYDEEAPEIVVSIGGDGTLLHAFHRYSHLLDQVAFVGIHTGHLGFYADWKPSELEKLVLSIAKKDFNVVEYPLLEVKVEHHNAESNTYLALNEATVKSPDVTLVMDVELNGNQFERFRGDGLCVSTPSGSTAYNKALGGAIIHPTLAALQITEIASINNRVFRTVGSPLILPAHHHCVLRPVNEQNFNMTVDHLQITQGDVKAIVFNVANERVRFARFRPFPFWERVHESFVANE
ncbi:NAD kinase [Lysinibacillus fusiformis]|jgi:NAD+ kinase|uniref:NAD kinase n=1 Tax=Lysinibacillus fusiformis TaxID=28031 RepID=A0A1E4R390_9BACI|nr:MULTISPECIES: NAD kinase [Lysinibacillus]HBJ02986.1 NAD kinase [Lysinibacillus sp.]AJK89269.1 inorganic polyphosphate kinase [Lysinibacillus fusiformis]KAB0442169.1 NAD(+) kinase [Lysinibacillus fusiformis]KEK10168.1 inorganic polyphosphate kinase [Lysinibacillus sphaericus]KGA82493.1 inorganic polyphosphate kinase [Lysinibacillus fusiformis]